jgi:hypothetical protein
VKLHAALIFMLCTSIALGDCAGAVRLKVGDVVKDCDRIGLSEAKDLEVRTLLREAEVTKKISDEQVKLLDMKDLQIGNEREQKENFKESDLRNRARADEYQEKANRNLIIGIGLGALAIILTGLAFKKVN